MFTVSTKLDVTGVKNKVMAIFYENLQNYNVTARKTTKSMQESIFLKVADDWERYEKETIQTFPMVSPSLTTVTDNLNESCSLLFTEEVLKFCTRHNIYHECCKYYTLFIDSFKHIQNIDIFISEDPEIPDYQKACFVLTIADSIENVLKYEDIFRKKIDKEIEVEKSQFFVYSYNLI